MGHWGVKSYENDEANDALDAGFDRVHGERYEELMDDRNPLTYEQVQQRLADPRTLEASIAALKDTVGDDVPPDDWDDECAAGSGRGGRPACGAEGPDPGGMAAAGDRLAGGRRSSGTRRRPAGCGARRRLTSCGKRPDPRRRGRSRASSPPGSHGNMGWRTAGLPIESSLQ